MEIKLFGKSLFSVGKSRGESLLFEATSSNRESKFLTDFYKSGNGTEWSSGNDTIRLIPTDIGTIATNNVAKTEEKKEEVPVERLTPKEVYTLKMLNDKGFKLNTDPIYVDKQIGDFKDKLSLIKSEEYDMRRGVEEIASILSRMENRKKYPEVKDFFENFPYTTTANISTLVKKYDHLQLGQIAQFMADLPNEAVGVMKDYNTFTDKVCGKQAVFYIIADKKDFKKNNVRRDPILLTQSPFGHVWQILGAWDEEMLLVDEL